MTKFTDEGLHQQAIAAAKSKFKIWPSAFGSAWMTRHYRQLYKAKKGRSGGAFKGRSDSLKTWFAEDWKAINSSGKIVGGCGDGETKGKVKCLPNSKARSLSSKDRSTLARRKQKQDPNPNREGAPVMVSSKKREDSMTPEVFAQAILSIERNYGLRLDARSTWLRLDAFKKVKELAGGKCNESKGWYGLKGGCKRGKKGEGEARNKESKVEIAGKIRTRKMNESSKKPGSKTGKKPEQSPVEIIPSKSQKRIDYEVKQNKLLDIESISSGSAKPVPSKVQSILKSGFQSELPIVVVKAKKGSVELDTDTYSGTEDIASYKEAVKRNPDLKGRMDVLIVASKEEAVEAMNQQNMISKHSKGREPIKENRILDIESFKTNNSDFKKDDIENLAKSIARNGGMYQGPQVRQSGLDEWTTRSRSDDFAVLAYRRAQELNPKIKGRIMTQFV